MGLIPCRECGAQISESATMCPHCGVPTAAEPQPTEQQKFEQCLALKKEELQLERERVDIEKERLALEKDFWRKKAAPLLGIAAAIVAGVITVGQVIVSYQQKRYEMGINHQRALLDQKISLMNKYALTYHQSCNALNAWHVFVLRRAREECKPAEDRNFKRIETLAQDERIARTAYYQTEPPDGAVAQIGCLFEGPSVKKAAEKAQKQWTERQNLLRDTVKKREEKILCKQDLTDMDDRRSNLQRQMNDHAFVLLQEMSTEISLFRLK